MIRTFTGRLIGLTAIALSLPACSGGGTPAPLTPPTSHEASGVRASAVAFTTEAATPAGRFYDTLGVNVHLAASGPYTNFPQTLAQLRSLGVSRFRDGLDATQSYLCSENRQLGAAGLRGNYLTTIAQQPGDLHAIAACAGPQAFDSLEAPNEYDLNHAPNDANWPAEMQTFVKMMYGSVHAGDPLLASAKVVGPAFSFGSSYQAVGDLSPFEDYGNMHDYFAGRNPGTPGWGSNGYGSIPWNMAASQTASATRPIVSTETGWAHADPPIGNGSLPEWAVALYGMRVYAEHYNAGVPRTYLYDFYDDGGSSFGNYGLIRGDGSAEPHWAYYAIRNLAGLLRDPYSATCPYTLTYTMTGVTTNVHHMLLHKSDGSLWLALWLEIPSVDPDSGAWNAIVPQPVTITLQTAAASATFYQTMMTTGAPVSRNVDSSKPMTFAIADQVSLLRLHW